MKIYFKILFGVSLLANIILAVFLYNKCIDYKYLDRDYLKLKVDYLDAQQEANKWKDKYYKTFDAWSNLIKNLPAK